MTLSSNLYHLWYKIGDFTRNISSFVCYLFWHSLSSFDVVRKKIPFINIDLHAMVGRPGRTVSRFPDSGHPPDWNTLRQTSKGLNSSCNQQEVRDIGDRICPGRKGCQREADQLQPSLPDHFLVKRDNFVQRRPATVDRCKGPLSQTPGGLKRVNVVLIEYGGFV